jgi:hypothetical protein
VCLAEVLVVAVALRLDLERRVVDLEVPGDTGAELVEQRADATGGEHRVGDGHVRREHRHPAGDRPGVQVVHVHHTGHAAQVVPDVVEVEVCRRRLQEHVDGVPHQRERPGQDQHRDQQRHHRVRADEAGAEHHQRGDDHPDGADQVAEHLEIGGPHVQRLVAPADQQRQRHRIREQADDREREHRPGVDVGRVHHASYALDRQVAADTEQHHGVQQRGQDLGAVQAEGPPRGGWEARDVRRGQRQADGGRVGQHVPRVGEQRERPADERADHLDDHHHGGDAQHDLQPRPVLRPAGGVRMRVAGHALSVDIGRCPPGCVGTTGRGACSAAVQGTLWRTRCC